MKSTMGVVNISKESSINKKKAIQTQEKNEPLKRKRKVATGDNLLAVKKFKGKGKKVCNLREIPLEILFEILYLLTPSDLVNLSQAGKDFESMFRGPDSPTIWKEVRHNVVPALPPCPPDLNELEFAELLFGKCCHYCAKKIMPLHTVWEARQRICNQCVKQWCTTEIPKMQLKSITDLQNYVPSICTYSGHRGTRYYFATIIDDWRKAYNKSKAKAKWKTSKIQELEMIRQVSYRIIWLLLSHIFISS
ncbi:hypothetical protein BDN70DRAFT_871943 [Pholiota conissans]|uniref:F-box domain-containing protein n=1 Tax=Pholiota conissans TaxID=109636 RepID=A0A9P5ZD44_9AGAR|nr:hypothetical protein BDN70DRAFT_871943 [Pholiota conissans]